MASAPNKLRWPLRAATAPASTALSRPLSALELNGPPVYVRKEIVHNKHVVEQLRERGAIFVEQETEVPEGETVIFSAHGVAPSVHANAEARGPDDRRHLPARDQGPREAKKFAADGLPSIVLVGHEGHRGGRGHDGRGARALRPRGDRGGRGRIRICRT